MRINKYVARATGMARRKVDDMITNGQISVNGQPARIGQPVEDGDVVALAGKPLTIPVYTYLMLNKPVGYVCSRNSQKSSQTVYDLLPSKFRSLKLVGRLDKDSSGLILLTDDGDFAHQMLHPSFGKAKIYEVKLNKELSKNAIDEIKSGVQLEDGVSNMTLQKISGKEVVAQLTEGRNRQIRRTFMALGYEVLALHRTKFGPYSLDDMAASEHKLIDLSQ